MKKILGLIACLLVLAAAIGGWYWLHHRRSTPIYRPIAFVGVGLYVGGKKAGKYRITRIFPNSPAEKAGLAPGVFLNKVNGELAGKKSANQLSKMLMGAVGTKVVLETIDDGGNTNTIEITREQFINRSTR